MVPSPSWVCVPHEGSRALRADWGPLSLIRQALKPDFAPLSPRSPLPHLPVRQRLPFGLSWASPFSLWTFLRPVGPVQVGALPRRGWACGVCCPCPPPRGLCLGISLSPGAVSAQALLSGVGRRKAGRRSASAHPGVSCIRGLWEMGDSWRQPRGGFFHLCHLN